MTQHATHSRPGDRTAAGFLKQESGSVTIFAIAGFAMCLVVTGLAFDIGRLMSIHTQASSYADKAALAAAGELDGRFNAGAGEFAIFNAVDAARGLGVGHRMTLGGDSTLRVARIRFYAELVTNPGTCTTANNPSCPRATWTATAGGGSWAYASGYTPSLASVYSKFALVDLEPENEEFLLLPLMGVFGVSGQGNATLPAAQSMAGFERRVCNVTPVMVCNPEDDTTAQGPAFDPTPAAGGNTYIFKLQGRRRDGELNPWGPGVYSFLKQSNTRNDASASTLRNYIRNTDPNTVCYGDTATVESSPNAGGGNDSDNTRHQIGRGWNDRWDQGSSRKRFPVAVVNCMDHRTALQNEQPVPIAGWAQGELLEGEDADDEAVDLDDSDRDDEIKLRNLGMIQPGAAAERNREFPVLVR